MLRSFGFLLCLLAAAVPVGALAAPDAVVELFTSQGCASCRSADIAIADLAKRDGVLVLSYHVDYWDFLGWRDTLASPDSAKRQRAYAKALGSRRIYTPQLLVNGTENLPGGDRDAIEKALRTSALPVAVRLDRKGGDVTIEIGAGPFAAARPTIIRLIALTSVATVKIARGENAGATIRYTNVASGMRSIGMWSGAVMKITLPESEVISEGADGCAVLVQEKLPDGPGKIIGAASLSASKP